MRPPPPAWPPKKGPPAARPTARPRPQQPQGPPHQKLVGDVLGKRQRQAGEVTRQFHEQAKQRITGGVAVAQQPTGGGHLGAVAPVITRGRAAEHQRPEQQKKSAPGGGFAPRGRVGKPRRVFFCRGRCFKVRDRGGIHGVGGIVSMPRRMARKGDVSGAPFL